MINEERRKIQLEAVQALEDSDYNGVFLLPTGTGKSWVLIECLKRLSKRYGKNIDIWYLCNSVDLRDKDFPAEMRTWRAKGLLENMILMCYQTAYKIEGEAVDVLIADEFDYSLTPEYMKVYLNNNFRHRILTTAYIAEDKLDLLDEIDIDIVYNKGLQEIEDKEVVNKSEYYYVNFLMSNAETLEYHKLTKKISDLIHKKSNDKTKARYYQVQIDFAIRERKRFINSLDTSASICKRLLKNIYEEDKKSKMLIFCELTKQADKICKYTYHNKSDPENLDKFRKDEIQALAVCGKVNRGVNINNIQHVILESCNRSKTQLIQRLGRGKRLKSDELLKVYFLIPCYLEGNKIKYTKVKEWVETAAEDLDLKDAKLYKFN